MGKGKNPRGRPETSPEIDCPELGALLVLADAGLSVQALLDSLSESSSISEVTRSNLRGAEYWLRESVISLCRDCPEVASRVQVAVFEV